LVTSRTLTGLFGRSPFKPMQEPIGVVARCAAPMPELVEALAAGDQERGMSFKDQIDGPEQRADDIKTLL